MQRFPGNAVSRPFSGKESEADEDSVSLMKKDAGEHEMVRGLQNQYA